MKRIIVLLFAIGAVAMSSVSMAAMSASRVRKETRFLTDKMAHELNLNTTQYNDVYEINYDFIYAVRNLMDDVIRGEEWAMDRYYASLDDRNDDLRWVLTSAQYRRFLGADYFCRPIYASGGKWTFRIYITYTNHNHFYFGKPYHYNSYCGGHYRRRNNNVSYYRGRYNHDFYSGSHSVRDEKSYRTNRRSDFGSVTIRPGSERRESSSSVRQSSGSNRVNVSSSGSDRKESGNSGRRNNSSSARDNGAAKRSSVTESSSSSSGRSSGTSSESSRSNSSRSSERSNRGK